MVLFAHIIVRISRCVEHSRVTCSTKRICSYNRTSLGANEENVVEKMYMDLHTLVSYPLLPFKTCLEAFFNFWVLPSTMNK